MSRGAGLATDLLIKLLHGTPLLDTLEEILQSSASKPAGRLFLELLDYPDHIVVGRNFSSACYMDQALPATLFLAAKYHDQPEQGVIANIMCGGDNCGRGSLLGALLGAACGVEAWPLRWRTGLLRQPALPS